VVVIKSADPAPPAGEAFATVVVGTGQLMGSAAPIDPAFVVVAIASAEQIRELDLRQASGLAETVLPRDWDAWIQPPGANPTVTVEEASSVSAATAGSFIQRLFPPGVEPVWAKRRPRPEQPQP
jgi:hypothetical protein